MGMRCRLYVSQAPLGLRLEKVSDSFATGLVSSFCDVRFITMDAGHSEARGGLSMMKKHVSGCPSFAYVGGCMCLERPHL